MGADDRILLSPPDVGPLEREALLRAFDSGWVAPAGPELDAFEADLAALTGWPGTVAMSSGTAALHLALLAHGVGPGDDVLVSSFTFAATANAVTYTRRDAQVRRQRTRVVEHGPAAARRRAGGGRRSGPAARRRGGGRPVRPVRRLRRHRAAVRAVRRAVGGGRRRGAGVVARGACCGHAGRHRNPVVQRQQDHHHVRRRRAAVTRHRGGRSCAVPGDAGASADGALRAHRRRFQLPLEQSVGGDGQGAAGQVAGDVGSPPGDQRALPAWARRCARSGLHADRAVVDCGRRRTLERLADVRDVRRSGASRPSAGRVVDRRHREPATVEADASPAGLRLDAGAGERHERATVRPWPVPAERQRPHRRAGRPGACPSSKPPEEPPTAGPRGISSGRRTRCQTHRVPNWWSSQSAAVVADSAGRRGCRLVGIRGR